jgi:hypothetical protein
MSTRWLLSKVDSTDYMLNVAHVRLLQTRAQGEPPAFSLYAFSEDIEGKDHQRVYTTGTAWLAAAMRRDLVAWMASADGAHGEVASGSRIVPALAATLVFDFAGREAAIIAANP